MDIMHSDTQPNLLLLIMRQIVQLSESSWLKETKHLEFGFIIKYLYGEVDLKTESTRKLAPHLSMGPEEAEGRSTFQINNTT